jgi:adenylate cyclase
VIAPLARVAEIRALRRTAGNLIETYVGHQTGERILAGKIRRGHVETLRAAIWLSDMRGFTLLAERLPPQALVDLLNQYFDCQVPAIAEHGGEVLKFMGDGLLAIFPLAADASDTALVCARTLAGARKAAARVADLANRRIAIGESAVRFGLALHVGQVMYGNIGGGSRLDFTCIGPAVNLAARLEKLTAKLGRTVIASTDFAAQVPEQFCTVGEFSVAGFAANQIIFGLPEETARG